MTLLTIIGGIVVTLVPLYFFTCLFFFYFISDYGFIDTTKWNWSKEKLWALYTECIVTGIIWWFLVGTHISIN